MEEGPDLSCCVNLQIVQCPYQRDEREPRPNGPTTLLFSSYSVEFDLAPVFASPLVHFDGLIAWPFGPDTFGGGVNH
jgi:hypothetical protein